MDSNQKDTVGQPGSSLAGGQNPTPTQDEQVTQNDLKGKKVDADPSKEEDKPTDQ